MKEFDKILTGLLTIDGQDVWTQYHAFLAEKGNTHINMDSLLRLPKAKEVTVVDFRERDGVNIPQNPNIRLSSIERTLQFCIIGETETDRFTRYKSFLEKIKSGKLDLFVKGYRTYKMIYRDMPSEPEWFTSLDKTRHRVVFQIKFLDYAPV